MEWQAVVAVMQILMLVVGWFLFQQARTELSAHAAETPVLAEVKALQRSIRQLIEELEATSETTADRLEQHCKEARELLAELDLRMDRLSSVPSETLQSRDEPYHDPSDLSRRLPQEAPLTNLRQEYRQRESNSNSVTPSIAIGGSSGTDRETIYALADQGETPAAIARAVGMSEGEVETFLGLRLQRR